MVSRRCTPYRRAMTEPTAPSRPRRLRLTRRRVIALAAAAVVVVALAVWFAPWRLLTSTTVDEALPGLEPVATSTPTPAATPAVATPTTTPGATTSAAPAASPAVSSSTSAAPSPAAPSSASTSSAAPSPVASTPVPARVDVSRGDLISHEHATSGSVRVVRLADGSRVLRLENLDTSDGPALHVWLSDAPVIDGRDGWNVFDDGAYVDLGALKGNRGNQNYAIPADVDLGRLRSVSIWCERFSVSFGAATLRPV